jgi:hypothetical protein
MMRGQIAARAHRGTRGSGINAANLSNHYEGKYNRVHAPQMLRHLGRRLWIRPYQHPHPAIGVASTSPELDTIGLAGERGWWPLSSSILQAPLLRAQSWRLMLTSVVSTLQALSLDGVPLPEFLWYPLLHSPAGVLRAEGVRCCTGTAAARRPRERQPAVPL